MTGNNGNIGVNNLGFGNIGKDNIRHCNIGNGNIRNNNNGNFNVRSVISGSNDNKLLGDFNCIENDLQALRFDANGSCQKYLKGNRKVYLEYLNRYIVEKWKTHYHLILGPYLSENVAHRLRSANLTVDNNKVENLTINLSNENRNGDVYFKPNDVDIFLSSFLYHMSNSKVSNIRLNEGESNSQDVIPKETGNDNTGNNSEKKPETKVDTFKLYRSLLSRSSKTRTAEQFQVAGISSIIKKGTLDNNLLYNAYVIDGKIPKSLNSVSGKMVPAVKKTKRSDLKAIKRTDDTYFRSYENNRANENVFPKVLYYHQGKHNKYKINNNRNSVNVDIVFIDKVITIPEDTESVMKNINTISERLILVQNYIKKYQDFQFLKQEHLMGIFTEDNPMIGAKRFNKLKKRGNDILKIKVDYESPNNESENTNEFLKQKEAQKEDKDNEYRNLEVKNKHRLWYVREKYSEKDKYIKKSNIINNDLSIKKNNKRSVPNNDINKSGKKSISISKREPFTSYDFDWCDPEKVALDFFVQRQFTNNLNHTLDFYNADPNTKIIYNYNSLYTVETQKYLENRFYVNDIIGKVITENGVIYVLKNTPNTKVCIPRYDYCNSFKVKAPSETLADGSTTTKANGRIIGGTLEIPLLMHNIKFDKNEEGDEDEEENEEDEEEDEEDVEEKYKFISDLGIESEDIILSTKSASKDDCLYAKYNIFDSNYNDGLKTDNGNNSKRSILQEKTNRQDKQYDSQKGVSNNKQYDSVAYNLNF
ncbi:hypothetical protein AYI69_g4698 [Smittium culicis]|uniref:Uncharacterized protein n=1 Tax=Smittium culicis TaxID=133412 RepID=A0A1R1YBJ9_9FUNG|nr:hypothetical protein AYI69_g4698 [Smittium culicis]